MWPTDITEHPTSEGKLCPSANCASNRIVGYSNHVTEVPAPTPTEDPHGAIAYAGQTH
jgi:hypothetical protein